MSTDLPVSVAECVDLVRVMSTLHRGLAARLSPHLVQRYGINLGLFVLLKRIEGGKTHPGALAQSTMEPASRISRQLDKLQAAGLVQRTVDGNDSRKIKLLLTEAAVALFAAVEVQFAELLGPSMSELAQSDRQVLIRSLELLANSVKIR